jgi:hypothetical protein
MQSAPDEVLLTWLARRDAPTGATTEPRAGDAIVQSAEAVLASSCPIVTSLLAFDDRLAAEIREQLERRDEPASLHAWGLQFATRLGGDADPWISWAAQVDAGTLAAAAAHGQADAACPGDPMRAIMLIASGTDPRR